MLFAWLIKLGHSSFHPSEAAWNDSVAFRSLVLMDDAVLIEPKIGLRPWMSVQTMETCTRKALGDGAINATKDEVEGALETRKLIWGLLYDTEKNTRALPPQKLEKASYLLRLPEFDYGNTRISLKLIQELRGNQQFWVSVLLSLKPLLSASNALLGPPTSEGLAQPRGTAEQQRRIWIRFWEAIELQRLLVDNRAEWGVRFTHPMTEALTVRELLAMPGHQNKVVWASGDATLDRVGAVDWTNKKAYSLEVQPYHCLIEKMEREALEDVNYPRRASRPGDDVEDEEPGKLMVALTELLAVLLLAVCQHEQWRGKTVLYMGDNQVVVKWINSRQAKHPFASYLLQVLAAVEACYGFHMHTAYLRTYHNVVADALTRKDAEEVIRGAGLEALPKPDEALQRFLDRGWQRRALVWAGQADADAEHACRLAETRNPTGPPKALIGSAVLEVCFVDLGSHSLGYPAALHASGAQPLEGDGGFPRRVSRPGRPILACVTLTTKEWKSSLDQLLLNIAEQEVNLLWVDSRDRYAVTEFGNELSRKGFITRIRSVCGRSLRDQVWWKRWVLTASRREELPFDWVVTDDEPCTPPLAGYPLEWLAEDDQIELERWEPGLNEGRLPGSGDLETRVEVDIHKASDLGCVFRKTGNGVWLCDRNIPTDAILSIREWDDLGARETDPRESRESASSSTQQAEFNSAALNLRAYRSGSWHPKLELRTVTEEVALAACDLGKNLPDDLKSGIEARIAPGSPGGDDECDWSAEDSDVEVVQAVPASCPSPKVEPKTETDNDETMGEEAGSDLATTSMVKTDQENEDVDMKEARTPRPNKAVEDLAPKAEEIIEDAAPTVRRRKIRFGSAHLHLLKAVADADAQNWESLQMAINSAPESAKAKSELVGRLEHLADLRVQSMVAAEKRAQEHAQRAKHYTEAETEYQRGLNDAMLRLEKMNPVGPRASVPIISDARLRQDIEAGKPIWQARREHRARERAAKYRQATAERPPLDTSQPSRLTEVSPSEGGEVLDEAFAASAKANLAEFKRVLREEAKAERKGKPRQADSERRKKIKKDRRKEKKANTKDDAERDRNHAIAHGTGRSEASFSPGLPGVILTATTGVSRGMESEGAIPVEERDYTFGVASGVLFDLGVVMMVFGTLWLCLSTIRLLKKALSQPGIRSSHSGFASPARRVEGLRRRFRTKERRMPVTPDMLKWLGEHLQHGRSQEASLLLNEADEVILVRGSKPGIYHRGYGPGEALGEVDKRQLPDLHPEST
eukprot:s776_g15.t1